MRTTTTQEFYVDGKIIRATLIEDPTIDDVVVAEMEAQAHTIRTGEIDKTRRVGRDIREILLRFGVQR